MFLLNVPSLPNTPLDAYDSECVLFMQIFNCYEVVDYWVLIVGL